MTVKELKEKLANIPDDMDVMLLQTDDERVYNMANTAEVRPVIFGDEGMPIEEYATVDCFVITDEF